VDVLGHHDVSGDAQPVPLTHPCKRLLEGIAASGRRELRLTLVAAECDEMQIAGLLESVQSLRHVRTIQRRAGGGKAVAASPPKQSLDGAPNSGVISSEGSRVKVLIVPADEEIIVARETVGVVERAAAGQKVR
jgi:hypothetical protein